MPQHGKWPCLFTVSDTTGEKDFEEFFMDDEELDLESFRSIGIVKSKLSTDAQKLDHFLAEINSMRKNGSWTKEEIVGLFQYMLPEFHHKETGKYLDSKM